MRTRRNAFAALLIATSSGGCTAAAATSDAPLPAFAPVTDLEPIELTSLCVTAGRVESVGARTLKVDVGGMRGIVTGPWTRSAELAFRYPGPSSVEAPLADGELRRQIGVKLRAQDACNVVYVMWRVAPSTGIFVQVKHNPALSTHEACGDRGYATVRATEGVQPAAIRAGEEHVLRADLDGDVLSVRADGVLAWKGVLPDEASTFDGPTGIRTDNGHFDFELRVPGGSSRGPVCPGLP